MKIKIVLITLIGLVLSGCQMESDELVDVNQPKNEKKQDFNNETIDNSQNIDPNAELTPEEQKAKEEWEKQEAEAGKKLEDDIALATEMLELDDAKKEGSAARGSCNSISTSSICLEYIGSFWTEQQMKLNCSDSGTFSLKPCEEGSYGGCNVGKGGTTDMITWMYPYGGGEINTEGAKYAKMACDATLGSAWINAK